MIRVDAAAGHRFRAIAAVFLAVWTTWSASAAGDERPSLAASGGDYREPSAAVTSLLTATPPPEPILHARDVETGQERMATPVNPAWGDPCRWVASDSLVCRLLPADRGTLPPEHPEPTLVEHGGGPAPTRTYPDLLENAYEDALFEHHFDVEIGRVGLDGRAQRVPGLRGLIASLEPSPDGAYAVVTRIEHPFSRLMPARRFRQQRTRQEGDPVRRRSARGAPVRLWQMSTKSDITAPRGGTTGGNRRIHQESP